MSSSLPYRRILAAVDFSPSSEVALRQAVWIARQSGAELILAHAFADLVAVAHSLSTDAKLDLLTGEGDKFRRELQKRSEARMGQMIANLDVAGLKLRYEAVWGRPYVELASAASAFGCDLVVAGTRGFGPLKQLLVGSTAKRLIRKCPCSVWVVEPHHAEPPRAILAATDFSDVSRRAAVEGWRVAEAAGAQFHLLHVVEPLELPEDVFGRLPEAEAFRPKLTEAAERSLEEFIESLGVDRKQIHVHHTGGLAWDEIRRITQELSIDLIALGTVGRSGIMGLLLGNTAEKVLDTCRTSILTVKPADLVSPIEAGDKPESP
jgi:nucleotide-binding universal stress UspA family protein